MTNRRKGSWQVGNKWQLHKGSYLLWSLVQPGENPPWPWCATSAACAQPGGDLLLTVVNCDGGRCHAPHPQQKKNPKGNWYEAEPRLALWGRGSGTSWDFLLTLCIPTAKGEILQGCETVPPMWSFRAFWGGGYVWYVCCCGLVEDGFLWDWAFSI